MDNKAVPKYQISEYDLPQVEEIYEEMLKKILENQKTKENLDISMEEAQDTARKIALAAIKYGDLSNQASKDYIFDIEDQEYKELFLFAKRVAAAIKKSIPCKRVGVAVLGMEVPHAHIHLVPMQSEGDMDFRKEKLSLTPDTFKEIAEKISSSFE